MAKVVWSVDALDDLEAVHRFIARDWVTRANSMIDRIVAAVDILTTMPLAGRVLPDVDLAGVREILAPPYRVLYELRNDVPVILRVIHSARDLPRLLGGNEPD